MCQLAEFRPWVPISIVVPEGARHGPKKFDRIGGTGEGEIVWVPHREDGGDEKFQFVSIPQRRIRVSALEHCPVGKKPMDAGDRHWCSDFMHVCEEIRSGHDIDRGGGDGGGAFVGCRVMLEIMP